jgi:hypothetical protein
MYIEQFRRYTIRNYRATKQQQNKCDNIKQSSRCYTTPEENLRVLSSTVCSGADSTIPENKPS